MFNKPGVLALDQHLLGLLAAEERDLLRELGQARVRVAEVARQLGGERSVLPEGGREGPYCRCTLISTVGGRGDTHEVLLRLGRAR